MTVNERRELCGPWPVRMPSGETITGMISGAELPFAVVYTKDGLMIAEWAWGTIDRAVADNRPLSA